MLNPVSFDQQCLFNAANYSSLSSSILTGNNIYYGLLINSNKSINDDSNLWLCFTGFDVLYSSVLDLWFDNDINLNYTVLCDGGRSCAQSLLELSHFQTIHCRGSYACNGTSIQYPRSVTCTGDYACAHSEVLNMLSVACYGSNSCIGSAITFDTSFGAQVATWNVYVLGSDALQYGAIYNSGINDILEMYIDAKHTQSQTMALYCDGMNVTCIIYCFGQSFEIDDDAGDTTSELITSCRDYFGIIECEEHNNTCIFYENEYNWTQEFAPTMYPTFQTTINNREFSTTNVPNTQKDDKQPGMYCVVL